MPNDWVKETVLNRQVLQLRAEVGGASLSDQMTIHAWMFASFAVLILIGTGCQSQTPTPRPTVLQLAQQSFAKSDANRVASDMQAASETASQFALASVEATTGARPLPSLDTPLSDQTNPGGDDQEWFEPIPVDGDFIETPLRDALNDLAADADIQLVLDDDVNGVVNIRFEEKTIDQAFELVLSAQAFYHKRIGKTMYVGPADPRSPVFPIISQRFEYRPKHAESKALMESVPLSYKDFVTHIEATRTILVEAPDRIAARIIQRFSSIDTPVPQVSLEAIVCVISPDSAKRIGLDWEHAVELDGEQALRFGVSGLGLGIDVSNSGVDALFSDFSHTSAFVNALCENGYLTIRAAPHVVAQDGEKASIVINRETFFSIQPQTSSNGDSNAFFIQQNVERVESGITFDITPHVRGNRVTVKIDKAEVSEDIRTVNADTAVNQFPIINRRSVSTTVSVNNGRTIVLGGLMQRQTVDRESSIPVLGSLPIFGHLFKTTERQVRDVEVVIFVSPKIIADQDMLSEID